MARKPLVAVTLQSGCFIPLSHALNQDGYFRKRSANDIEMFHRTMWRHHGGVIPEGYEIDHICGNRACFNVKHLRTLIRKDHLIHTNKTRYSSRKKRAYEAWVSSDQTLTGTELGKMFGVTYSTGCRWVREWIK